MAELWEISVVLAIRDLQWLMRKNSIPMPTVNLSGNAESRLGDCLITAEDRFFIIEVKPTSKNFKSEWAVEEITGKKRFKKRAFASAYEMASKLDGDKNLTTASGNVLRSLLGHHFVFWNETDGTLAIQPYLSATLKGYANSKEIEDSLLATKRNRRVNNLFSFSLSDHAPIDDFVTYTECDFGFLSAIYSQRLGIAIKSNKPGNRAWIPIGLRAPDFNDYLQILCQKAEEINAIILSDKGFIHTPRNTNDITDFLSALSKRIDELKKDPQSVHRGKPPMPVQQAAPEKDRMSAPTLDIADYLRAKPSTPGYK